MAKTRKKRKRKKKTNTYDKKHLFSPGKLYDS